MRVLYGWYVFDTFGFAIIVFIYAIIKQRTNAVPIGTKVQLSSEMWDFASPYEAVTNQKNHNESSCHIYFDKFVAFARRLFDKWKKLEVRLMKCEICYQ